MLIRFHQILFKVYQNSPNWAYLIIGHRNNQILYAQYNYGKFIGLNYIDSWPAEGGWSNKPIAYDRIPTKKECINYCKGLGIVDVKWEPFIK